MYGIFRIALLMILPVLVQACVKSRVEVIRECDRETPKFEKVSILRFVNGVGDRLPYAAPIEFAAALEAKLKQKHPKAFSKVLTWPSRRKGILMVQGQIMEYDPGSKVKRALLLGQGSGRLKLEVVLVNSFSRKTVERFSITNRARPMEDMIDSAMDGVVERMVQYSSGQ